MCSFIVYLMVLVSCLAVNNANNLALEVAQLYLISLCGLRKSPNRSTRLSAAWDTSLLIDNVINTWTCGY